MTIKNYWLIFLSVSTTNSSKRFFSAVCSLKTQVFEAFWQTHRRNSIGRSCMANSFRICHLNMESCIAFAFWTPMEWHQQIFQKNSAICRQEWFWVYNHRDGFVVFHKIDNISQQFYCQIHVHVWLEKSEISVISRNSRRRGLCFPTKCSIFRNNFTATFM